MNNPDKLANHRSTVDLPLYSDIVIIGSGYAGSACAYYLYSQEQSNQRPQTITMLEARETCSGATGRTSGTLTPNVYSSYKSYLEQYGHQTADALINFEMKHIDVLSEIISKENIQCDWELKRICHAFYDFESAAQAKASYEQRRDDGGNVADIHEIPSNDLLPVARLRNAFYGLTIIGASLHPYKLIHHFLNKCVEKGMNLQTNTPVLSATVLPSGQWSIVTSRGTLQASKVIFASNAYTGGIVPILSDKIIPGRAAACRILPPTNYVLSPLKMSYLLRSKEGQFDYLLTRPTEDRSIILGGGRSSFVSDQDAWYNNWDDSSETINEKSKQYFEDFMAKYFDNWESDHSGCKEMWTGVIGLTSDYMPFVGELPDQTEGYVIAGFNGHGISRILLCARALIDLVLKKVNSINGLIPEPFVITKTRLEA
jgi:glycine/D-amino acid oxidase-like deaminating enzyme